MNSNLDLRNSDCLDLLDSLPPESVDLIIADPPYFEILKAEWDRQWESESRYLAWCARWTAACSRALKPSGALYVWGTTKTDTFLRYKLDVLERVPELVYRNWIIWRIPDGTFIKESRINLR